MGSSFTEIEQAAIWNLTGSTSGGTNDFDPLIAIFESLREEHVRDIKKDAFVPTTLERIRA